MEELFGEGFGLLGEAEVCADDELESFDGVVAEPVAVLGRGGLWFRFDEVDDLVGGVVGDAHGECEEGAGGIGEVFAT